MSIVEMLSLISSEFFLAAMESRSA